MRSGSLILFKILELLKIKKDDHKLGITLF